MINLKLDADVIADVETTGGGGNKRVWDAGVYDVIVEMATVEESKGGATSVNVTLKNSDKESKLFPLRDTFWITSGTAKGANPYYVDKAGKKHPLPGYTVANRMCIAMTGNPLNEVIPTGEKKTINAYSWEAKKEVPTEKFVLTDLIGKPVKIALVTNLENKRAKNIASGVYEATAETIEKNEVRYFANIVTGLSVDEMAAGTTEPTFMAEWASKNTTMQQIVDGVTTTVPRVNDKTTFKGTAPAASGTETAKTSIFS
jgi:hypothetical protein